MQSKSKKTVSLVVVSIFVFSMLFASVPLALAQPSLDLNPTNGPSGTVVTIDGNGFTSGTYRVYFDRDGDERLDWNEPYRTVSVNETGKFTTTLTVPSVASGLYYIRADSPPYNPPAKASALFTVTVIIMNLPPAAIDFTSVLDAIADIEGKLWSNLDSLKNEIKAIEAKLDDAKTGLPGIQANFTTVFSLIGTPKVDLASDIAAIEAKLDSATLSTIDLIDDILTWLTTDANIVDDSELNAAVTSLKGSIDSAVSSLEGSIDAAVSSLEGSIDLAVVSIESFIDAAVASLESSIDTATTSIITEINANGAKIDAIKALIGTPVTTIAGDIAAIEDKLDLLVVDVNSNSVPDFIEEIDAIKAKTDTINWSDVTAIKTAVETTIPNLISSAKSDIIDDIESKLTAARLANIDLIYDINDKLTTERLAKIDSIVWTDITAIKTEIGDISADSGRASWTTLGVALDDIKTKIEGIDTDMGSLLTKSGFDTAIGALKTQLESKIDTAKGDILTAITGAKNDIIADIESKLTPARLAKIDDLLTKTYFDSVFTPIRLDNIDLIYDINTYLTGTIYPAIDEVEGLLKNPTYGLSALNTDLDTILSRIGTFTGTDTVASLLYDIKAKLDAVKGGDVIASKYENDKAVTSASPYYINGLPANKVFRGTITLQIDTALGGSQTLGIEVWDGDSWARVWTSAASAAGTSVSIDIAGITDANGNAIRIVTTATASRNFDYVFAYNIDVG